MHICKKCSTFAAQTKITTMKNVIKCFMLALAAMTIMPINAATYTKLEGKPSNGWNGLKCLIVYEVSATKAYVWDITDGTNNYAEATIADGKITGDNFANYEVSISQENTNRYYLHTAEGYIGGEAKKNSILFDNSGHECTLAINGSYTILETNTNTCRFLYNTDGNRFRFFYDKDKKWNDTKKKNICFYALGDVAQEEPKNKLDLGYAQANLYACDSKFPTQNNQVDQYFYTQLFLGQEESYEAVPQVNLEILAPTQYSLAGTYRSDYTAGKKYFLNCQAGSKHSYFIFPNSSAQGWGEASIKVAEMTITKVGKSKYPNAYVYHIKLVFTDSNQKIWTLDKDMDVYGTWSDCDRSGEEPADMPYVAFAFESGNHNTETEGAATAIANQMVNGKCPNGKYIHNGHLYIQRGEELFNAQGARVK